MVKVRSYYYFSILIAVTLIYGLLIMADTSEAAGVNYYISTSGSNANNGTSSSTPWADFTNVNSRTFQPGDKILLKSGDTWTKSGSGNIIALLGSGTATDWITIESYGAGAKPIIDGSSSRTLHGITGSNNSYIVVQNIELKNMGNCIAFNYTTLGNQGLRFNNLYLHNSGYGVLVNGSVATAPTSTQWMVKDIQVTNSEIGNNSNSGGGITFAAQLNSDTVYSSAPSHTIQNGLIQKNYIHDNGDGNALAAAKDILILNNIYDGNATEYRPQGTTNYFLWRTNNIKFINNSFKNTAYSNSLDQSAIDSEGYNDYTILQGNYFASNAGPAIEYLSLSGRTGDFSTNNEVSSNSFYDNGTAGATNYRGSMIRHDESGVTFNGTAQNNFYYDTYGFTGGSDASQFSTNWTMTNNLGINLNNMYNAANGFSGTQGQNGWSYQYYNGSAYSNLSYSSGSWTGGSTNVMNQFDIYPGPNSSYWSARAWTAPSAGTVSLRGWVLKSDPTAGDGVKAKITKNGTIIWPTSGTPQVIAYNNQIGYATNLDNISVAANDVIRFEINNNNGSEAGDTTSWIPTVAYSGNGITIINDDASGITYSGSWADSNNRGLGDYSDDLHYSTVNNDYFEYTFTGTNVDYINEKNFDLGNVDIYIDNVFQQTVSSYNATRLVQQTIYSKTGLSLGTHTIKVVKKTGTYITLDAIAFHTATTINDDASGITYSGSWADSNSRGLGDYNDDLHYSTVNNDYFEYTFTGTNIDYITEKSNDQGNVDIYIDNVFQQTVSCYNATTPLQQTIYSKTGLSLGTHTIKVVKKTGTYITLDALKI